MPLAKTPPTRGQPKNFVLRPPSAVQAEGLAEITGVSAQHSDPRLISGIPPGCFFFRRFREDIRLESQRELRSVPSWRRVVHLRGI